MSINRHIKVIVFAVLTSSLLATIGGGNSHALQLDLADSNYRDNQVLFVSPSAYPRNTSLANWPLRSDRCPAVSGFPLKTFYMQPTYGNFLGVGPVNPMNDPYPNSPTVANPARSGNNADWASQCNSTPITPTSFRNNTYWLFDAGGRSTGQSPNGITLPGPGPWIYPEAYGGWAQFGFTPTGSWTNAVRTSGGSLHSGQLSDHYAGGPACSIGPCGDDYIIWSSQNDNTTNWFNSMVTSSRSPFVPSANPLNPGEPFGINSNGTTLFHREFNVTREQYDRIVAADESGASGQGLYLDINADDFYNVYINGIPAVSSTTTVSFQRLVINSPRDILRVGRNVIAIQVSDKLVGRANDTFADSIAAGLWYNLRGEVPDATPVITPSVTASPKLITPGDTVRFDFSVQNEGFEDGSGSNYQISYRTSNPSASGSCTRSGSLSWLSRSSNFVPLRDCEFEEFAYDSSWGNELCARLTIQNPRGPGTSPETAEDCVTLARVPLVQFSGGDVIVRSGVINTPPVRGSSQYGSWAEYGVFGDDDINSFSGGPGAVATNNQGLLTFANTSTPQGSFGGLGSANEPTLPDWPTRQAGGTLINLNDLRDREILEYSSNATLFGGGPLGGFRNAARLSVEGTLTIQSNIRYADGPYTSLDDLPQLIIEADAINLGPGVSQLDAWLIVDGRTVTCNQNLPASGEDYYENLTTSRCSNKLTINGPVQTNSVWLRRTNGYEGSDDSRRADPAEVFNLRSDTYLWAYGQAAGENVIRTETVSELPPRF